jgi:hypothetical protein
MECQAAPLDSNPYNALTITTVCPIRLGQNSRPAVVWTRSFVDAFRYAHPILADRMSISFNAVFCFSNTTFSPVLPWTVWFSVCSLDGKVIRIETVIKAVLVLDGTEDSSITCLQYPRFLGIFLDVFFVFFVFFFFQGKAWRGKPPEQIYVESSTGTLQSRRTGASVSILYMHHYSFCLSSLSVSSSCLLCFHSLLCLYNSSDPYNFSIRKIPFYLSLLSFL